MRGFKQWLIEERGYQPPKPRTPEGQYRFDKMVRQIRDRTANPSSRPATPSSI